jgi:hypothetical protein
MSSFEQDVDILHGRAGRSKSLLMSDVDTTCVISNQDFTFDDDALLDLSGFNCVTALTGRKITLPSTASVAGARGTIYSLAGELQRNKSERDVEPLHGLRQ